MVGLSPLTLTGFSRLGKRIATTPCAMKRVPHAAVEGAGRVSWQTYDSAGQGDGNPFAGKFLSQFRLLKFYFVHHA